LAMGSSAVSTSCITVNDSHGDRIADARMLAVSFAVGCFIRCWLGIAFCRCKCVFVLVVGCCRCRCRFKCLLSISCEAWKLMLAILSMLHWNAFDQERNLSICVWCGAAWRVSCCVVAALSLRMSSWLVCDPNGRTASIVRSIATHTNCARDSTHACPRARMSVSTAARTNERAKE